MTIDQKIGMIDLIGKTLEKLSSARYEWSDMEACNCGVFVQTALNISADDLLERIDQTNGEEFRGTWENIIPVKKRKCSVTGISIRTIYGELSDLGMSIKDIRHMEYLSDPDILKEMGIKNWEKEIEDDSLFTDKATFMKYLSAWKTILEREVVCPTK